MAVGSILAKRFTINFTAPPKKKKSVNLSKFQCGGEE
jgi:hypothetical protein